MNPDILLPPFIIVLSKLQSTMDKTVVTAAEFCYKSTCDEYKNETASLTSSDLGFSETVCSRAYYFSNVAVRYILKAQNSLYVHNRVRELGVALRKIAAPEE